MYATACVYLKSAVFPLKEGFLRNAANYIKGIFAHLQIIKGESYMDRSYSEIFKPGQPEFWKNLWFYNKKIIISVLVAVLIIIYTVSSCVSKPSADASVVLVTRNSRTPEATGELEKSFARAVEDINGDGKITVDVTEVYVPVVGSDELDTSNSIRTVNEIINGEASVIIAEKALVERFFAEKAMKKTRSFRVLV